MGELAKAFSGPHWVVGNGTGTDTLGAQYVSEFLKEPMPDVAVEEGFGQMIAEMGILAPVLWILWAAATVGACWKIASFAEGDAFFSHSSGHILGMHFCFCLPCPIWVWMRIRIT